MSAPAIARHAVPEDAVVFVLGSGRSGSSALTRVLALCGGRLPGALLPANPSNPTGFWEPHDAVHANARFLVKGGSSFFDTQLAQHIQVDASSNRAFVEETAEFLKANRSPDRSAPLIVKEPRISLLLPFWIEAAEAAGFSPRVVIPVRHPNEVAASLGKWKGVPDDHAAELWLKYNLLAERHTRHLPRCFVSFAGLLSDWRGAVRAIAQALELDFTPNALVDDFLDPALCHALSEDEEPRSETPWLREVCSTLFAACRDQEVDTGTLDAAFAGLSRAQATGALRVVRSFGTDFGVS